MEDKTMRPYWVSWYSNGAFELHSPWWVSGFEVGGDERDTIVAAIMAESELDAREKIRAAHDNSRDVSLAFRFCEERPADFSPFSERFPRADWMVW